MDKKIQSLRIFFRVSNASFDSLMLIQKAFGGMPAITPMHQLHKLALEEIEKENPDLLLIDSLLEQMQSLAAGCNQPKPTYPQGTA